MILMDKFSEFDPWCITVKREPKYWDAFKEFLILTYCNVINHLDVYARIGRLATPTTSVNIDDERVRLLGQDSIEVYGMGLH
ncbi:hypothetical protein IW138_000713 [Coemansia sp. RSA 986]|nr:hypothetical protein IW138_000713 [Coemansia sp. RSA 986]